MEKFLYEQKEMRRRMEKRLEDITSSYQTEMDDADKRHFELAKHYTYSFLVSDSLCCEWHFTEMAKHYQTLLPQKVERALRLALRECVLEVRTTN